MADEAASRAARHVLRKCFKKSARLIARCAGSSEPDAEDIHRLRVSIRRADAAMITFRPFLPCKKRRRLRKRLKRLRQRAGEIRDVDVLLERLASLTKCRESHMPAPGKRLQNKRRALADKLREAARREVDEHFKRRSARLVKRTRWRDAEPESSLADVARGLLRPVVERLREAGNDDLSDLGRLHQFRLSVKRLRYALEFVESGLDAGSCAPIRPRLSELQSALGRVCDHAATARLLEAECESLRGEAPEDALTAAIRQERELLAKRHAAFVESWKSRGQDDLMRVINACLG